MTDVEGQIAIDALERAGAVQAACAAGADGPIDGIQCEVLDEVTREASGLLGFVVVAGLPQPCDVPEPEEAGLHIDRHLADVLLDVRVAALAMGRQGLDGEVVGGLCGAKKAGGVMRAEAGLPRLREVLAGEADDMVVRQVGLLEADAMTDRRAHTDRIPPRTVDRIVGSRRLQASSRTLSAGPSVRRAPPGPAVLTSRIAQSAAPALVQNTLLP